MANITFLGGAKTVTGSKFLVESHGKKIMIDCGLFQGLKELRALNREALPIRGSELDVIILTHAHLDHSGYLPVLVKDGFAGPIYCTEPTRELVQVILRDSARIQMEDADFANEHQYSKHHPALPLYNSLDAERVFPLIKTMPLNEWQTLFEKINVRFSHSGHILGSAFVELEIQDKIAVFSGDIGRENPLLLKPRIQIEQADTLVLECTYGDKRHPPHDPKEKLKNIINETVSGGGSVLIPAFALGRTQEILFLIKQLQDEDAIPLKLPVYLDSPMGSEVTKIFDHFPDWHDLKENDIKSLSRVFTHIGTPKESFALCESSKPAIIIAGSGMLNGGRIRHHLRTRISNPKHTVVLVGFQAEGTPGRFLKEGASELKLFGAYLPVNARIAEISSLSAHADQHELMNWVKGFKVLPEKIFLIHGESHALEGMRVRLSDATQKTVVIPKLFEKQNLFNS